MAKATTGSVTLELTPSEAKALHALTGGTAPMGVLSTEISDVFDALESAGVSSVGVVTTWDSGCDGVYLVEA